MEDQAAEIATLRFARKKLEANLLFFMTKLEKELPAFEKRRKQVQELRMMLVRPIHPLMRNGAQSVSVILSVRSTRSSDDTPSATSAAHKTRMPATR